MKQVNNQSMSNMKYNEISLRIINNSIDYSLYHFISDNNYIYNKYSLENNKKYVCCVANDIKQDAIDFILNIVKNEKRDLNIIFVLILPNNLIELISGQIKQEEIDNIIVLENTVNINELMNISSCVILPFLDIHSSVSLLEAQACGVPCIVSNKISNEYNLGGCNYIGDDINDWWDMIKKKCNESSKVPLYSTDYDIKYTAKILDYVRQGITSDEFVQYGKEYSLGSKRVLRSKELSYLCFRTAKELGNIRGAFYYALAFFEGTGTSKNKKKAYEIVKQYKDRLCDEAFKEMEESNHDSKYLVIYGDMFSFGLGEELNNDKAFEIYRKAAEKGNLEAMCNLGFMYLLGIGVEKNEESSFYWFKTSADLGYVHSMRDVGQNYLYGYGVKKNIPEAERYFKLASENNYSHGTIDYAQCLISRNSDLEKLTRLCLLGLKQDYERTFRDIVEMGFDVIILEKEKRLVKNNITIIDSIDGTNSYKGTLYITSRINKIDPGCFYTHKDIFKIFVEKNNTYYRSIDGILYSKDKKTLVRFPLGLNISTFSVPDYVEIIGKNAFQNCQQLEEVILPSSISKIEDGAFDDCKNLKTINIPKNVKEIGEWAFHGCDKILIFRLPDEIEKIGEYAFGSCLSLETIEISNNNKNYKTKDGVLYSKDMNELVQYPIGKKQDIFIVPNSVKHLCFRCFSDAMILKEIDCRNVEIIEEKVFYYCIKLQKIIINKKAVLNGNDIFGHTPKDIDIKKVGYSFYIVSDIHGHIRLPWLKTELTNYIIAKNDYLIITGDTGICWNSSQNTMVIDFYNNIGCKVLFIDGNHEDFDRLYSYPIVNFNGGYAHKITNNIFHVMRGEICILNDKTFFCFGGGFSAKSITNSSPIKIWKEELPNDIEYIKGNENLKKLDYKIDYIITHSAPNSFLERNNLPIYNNEKQLVLFLEEINKKTNYKHWFFGHYHQDLDQDGLSCIYSRIIKVEN